MRYVIVGLSTCLITLMLVWVMLDGRPSGSPWAAAERADGVVKYRLVCIEGIAFVVAVGGGLTVMPAVPDTTKALQCSPDMVIEEKK